MSDETKFARGCDECGRLDCHKSFASRKIDDKGGINAFILDEKWPEFAKFLSVNHCQTDQILSPGFFGQAILSRYDWHKSACHFATYETFGRHFDMRRVKNASGRIRQMAYLKNNAKLALALGKNLNHLATHLIISQNFLPTLQKFGFLGGRTYDVLMGQYPLELIHKKLDNAARRLQSPTISDFRAPQNLIDLENQALENANTIITPHHGIASHFAHKALVLDWRMPTARPHKKGNRVAFLGPTIARQGIHTAREIANTLNTALIVFGQDIEDPNFWKGANIEKRFMNENWLDDIGALIHPAIMTNQPRKLLEAQASGVKIYATPECGLAPSQFIPISKFRA